MGSLYAYPEPDQETGPSCGDICEVARLVAYVTIPFVVAQQALFLVPVRYDYQGEGVPAISNQTNALLAQQNCIQNAVGSLVGEAAQVATGENKKVGCHFEEEKRSCQVITVWRGANGTSPSNFKRRPQDVPGLSANEDYDKAKRGGACAVPFRILLCVPKVQGATGTIVGMETDLGAGIFTPNAGNPTHWDLAVPAPSENWKNIFSTYAKTVGCQ